jgi:RNA polymerase sigma-70 factor (ECF subfamily)
MDAQERQSKLDQALQGNTEALGELLHSFRPYIRVLVRACRSARLRAPLDDSDLIQDACLEAQRSFADFRGTTVAELLAWLRRLVLRTAGRTLRGFVGTAKRDPSREQTAEDLDRLADKSGSSPSAQAIRHEQAARMAEAVARLPEDMQQVLLARHMDGLAHAVIAAQIGRTESAVRMLYLRALRRLRELYRE